MRRDNCQFAEYEAWIEAGCNATRIDPGCSVVGPALDPLGDPDSPPWSLDFAIIYPGQMYIRIGEYYRQLPRSAGGGGCLQYFSYHYGSFSGAVDRDGFPVMVKQFELRVDIDRWHTRHIHYQNEDHIPEDRLPGLDFSAIDPFVFIRAVEEHRGTKKQLHEILGFRVEP